MSGPRSLCRLCVTACHNYKSLYDDGGKANILYEMALEYFHPKIVDLEKAKHLTVICLQCFRHIRGFHTFQFSVMMAQAKLIEKDKIIATTAGREQKQNQNSPVKSPKRIKIEKAEEEFIGLSEYGENKDRSLNVDTLECKKAKDTDSRELTTDALTEVVFIGNEFVPLSELPIDDHFTQLTSKDTNETAPFHNANEKVLAKPKLEIMDVDQCTSDAEISDEELSLGQVVAGNQTGTPPKAQQVHPQRLKSTCNICGKVCNSSHLEDHYRDRHNSNNLPDGRTTLCGETMYVGATFRKHRSLVHSTKHDRFVCGKNCKTTRYLREHMACHLKTTTYKCASCPGTYRTRDAVYEHRKQYHPLKSSTDGYVVISENDEMQSKRNEIGCNTTDSATAPSTSKSAADRKMNIDDYQNYLNSADDVSQEGDRNISSLADVKHISLPELTIMDVNSEFITDDEIPLAERLASKRKSQTSEDDVSSDSDSIGSNDDDDKYKLKNKSRPRPQVLKTSDHLGDQQIHSESEHKFPCKKCQKQFDSQKGLAVHITRIHRTCP